MRKMDTPSNIITNGKQLRAMFTMLEMPIPDWLIDGNCYEIEGKDIYETQFDENGEPCGRVKL